MTQPRPMLALMLVMAGVLLVAGSLTQSSNNNTLTPYIQNSIEIPDVTIPAFGLGNLGQEHCPVNERRVFTVTQGESFTYQGTASDSNTHTVRVSYYSDQDWLFFHGLPDPVPVNSDKTFTFSISGNITKQFWNDYTSVGGSSYNHVKYSPYLHVCLNYSITNECFDLLIIRDVKNLTSLKRNTWIQIDPIPDQVITFSERQQYSGGFFINGTTNLLPDDDISLIMGSTCMLPCPKTASDDIGCCGSNFERVVKVKEGFCGINTWSVLVNTTPNRIRLVSVNNEIGDRNGFLVSVTRQNRIADDNAWDSANFVIRVKDEPSPFYNDIVLGREQGGFIGVIEVLILYGIIGAGIIAFLRYKRKG